ncbi:MAG: FMN-binding protein [Clostridiaceae bacterium]|nr:FMN-binding protein [Clostridiaceae bacterium]
MNAVKRLSPAVKLVIICVVCTLLLSATYELTRGRIEMQSQQAQRERLSVLFLDGNRFEDVPLDKDISGTLEELDAKPDSITRVYNTNDSLIGTAVTATTQGYGGDVIVTVAFSVDGSIVGISVSATGETPNVGDKVNGSVTSISVEEINAYNATDGERFLAQFISVPPFTEVSSGSGDVNHVDVISRATVSSEATIKAFNKAVKAFIYINEKGAAENE